MSRAPVGTACIVLHSHLPWLAHHGTWPVGEEWLHQAWSAAYLPLVEILHRLAEDGHEELLTLGVTPVLAAQLDDPHCLREHHGWLGRWRLRAEELAARPDPHLRELASHEFRAAVAALDGFERRWAHGGSAALRPLLDAGVVQHLGGPATHAFQPLLPDSVVQFGLRTGLDDAAVRLGSRPTGIWAPECAHRPGLEQAYAALGVDHFLVDEATLVASGGRTGRGRSATAASWSSAATWP